MLFRKSVKIRTDADGRPVGISISVLDEVRAYIDENYAAPFRFESAANSDTCFDAEADFIELEPVPEPEVCEDMPFPAVMACAPAPESKKRSLDELMNNIGETFQQRLFRLIDERGRDDVDVYKGAFKDKKLFHKIRSNVNYQPSKHTVFAFAISLRLTLDETVDLLRSAGFALTPSSKFDLIMQYVFEHGIYDMYKIDCILFDCGQSDYFACER